MDTLLFIASTALMWLGVLSIPLTIIAIIIILITTVINHLNDPEIFRILLERFITVVFVIVGAILVAIIFYSWGAVLNVIRLYYF